MDVLLAPRLQPPTWWAPLVGSFSQKRSSLLKAALLICVGAGFLYHPLFLAGALIAAFVLTIGLIKPRFMLYIALFFGIMELIHVSYYQDLTLMTAGYVVHSTYAPLFLVVTLMCWLAARLAGLIPPVPQTNTLDLPVFLMCFSSIISLLWTPHFFDGAKIVFYSIESVIWFFLFTRLIRTIDHVKFHFRFVLVMAVIITISAILAFFTSVEIGSSWTIEFVRGQFLKIHQITIPKYTGKRGNIGGLLSTAKALAPFLIVAIPFAVTVLCQQTKVWRRRVLQVWLVIMVTLLLLTLSRVDMTGLGLGWLAFVYLNPHWRKKFFRYQAYMALVVVIAYILAFSLLYTFYQTEEFEDRLGLAEAKYTTHGGGSAGGRIHQFLLTYDYMIETYGLGAGVGGLTRYIDPDFKMGVGSAFNGIFTEHGYGLLSYLIFFWMFANIVIEVRRGHRRWQYDPYGYYLRALIWALIGYATTSLLDYVFYSHRYFILIGVSIAAVRLAQAPDENLKDNYTSGPSTINSI